nr:glycosyltransferase [Rhodovibrio salinarum]
MFDAIQAAADPNTVVERNRADFPLLLAGCRLSVSQAGYNTVTEVLAAGVASVVVPFEGDGGEREQALRAERLAARGRLVSVREVGLTPQRLAQAIDRALAGPPVRQIDEATVDLAGIRNSSQILRELVAMVPTGGTGRTATGPTEAW